MSGTKSIIEIENLLSRYSQYYDVEHKTPLLAFWDVLERYTVPFLKLQEHVPELTQYGTIEENILRSYGASIHKKSVDMLTIEAMAYKFESGHMPSATVNNLHKLVNTFTSKEANAENKQDELNAIYWCTSSIIIFCDQVNRIVETIKRSGVHIDKVKISSALLSIHHAMTQIQQTDAMPQAVRVLNKCAGEVVVSETRALFVQENIVKVIQSELIIGMVQHITLDITVATQSVPTMQPLIDSYTAKKKNDIDKFYSKHVDRERFAIDRLIDRIRDINIVHLVAYSETSKVKLQEAHIDLLKYAHITNNIYTYISDIFPHQLSSIQLSLFVQADWKQVDQKKELGNILEDIKQLLTELKDLDNKLFATFIGKYAFMDYIESLNYQSDSLTSMLLVGVKPVDTSASEIIEVFLVLIELLSTNLNRLLIDYDEDRRILANWRAVIEENDKFVESIEIVCKGLSNIHHIVWEEYSKIT